MRAAMELRISGHHRRAVTGIMPLRLEGAEGERSLTGYLEDRGRRITGVEVVVALVGEEKDVAAAERGNLLQVLVRRRRAGRIVGVVDPECPDVLRVQLFYPEQNLSSAFNLTAPVPAGEEGAPLVDRVAGRRRPRAARARGAGRPEERGRSPPWSRSRQDLRLGVERDAIAALHPARRRPRAAPLALSARVLAHLGDAVYEGQPYPWVRRLARVAGAEVEELDAPLSELRAGALPGGAG